MDQNENNDNETAVPIDPDYESTNTAIRKIELKEEQENKLTEDKLKNIIQDEFDKELSNRQNQLHEIEEKILRAQKLLHMVRYVLISSYYNSKALEYESSEYSSLEATNILSGQNRIHPAVKKLLGNNVKNLDFLSARSKRKAAVKAESDILGPSEAKKIKIESNENRVSESIKIDHSKNVKQEIITNRKKIQHKLVIGNISYFKKSLEQDNLTHKWMAYVKIFKGTKDGPEISNLIICKVIFHLHPSYQPHNVVEISNPPYHLSRRGWGEFPLRVQIYFKSSLNKPVDVIHKLKLDKTFTERQTLGNETVVPIFLYDEQYINMENNERSGTTSGIQTVNNNYSTASEFCTPNIKHETLCNYEHNYCYDNENIKQETLNVKEETIVENSKDIENITDEGSSGVENINILLCDHSYSLHHSKKALNLPKRSKSPVKQSYNELIYGLGQNYLNPHRSRSRNLKTKATENVSSTSDKDKSPVKVLKTVTGQSIRFLPESFSQVLLTNGNVSVNFLKSSTDTSTGSNKKVLNLENKSSSTHQMETSHNRRISCKVLKEFIRQEKYLLKIPTIRFKNMGEALPYLFKRLPLWTHQANELEYKCVYPFTASSRKEFESWNKGKKAAAEWSRAKTIRRILSGESYSQNWNTKAIFMYGRSHLYTPTVSSYKLFANESLEKNMILNCFTNHGNQNGYPIRMDECEENIDVTSSVDDYQNHYSEISIDISDKKLTHQCTFIKEAALDVGVVLKPEELTKGVTMNASERVIYEAVKCFAENIIRRSRNFMICEKNYQTETAIISTREIKKALDERTEFASIKKFKEDKMAMDFFS